MAGILHDWMRHTYTHTLLPHKAAEEAKKCVQEANLVGDGCDDGLLAVWTHCLHWCRLEHLALQHRHHGGGSQGGQHCGGPAWLGRVATGGGLSHYKVTQSGYAVSGDTPDAECAMLWYLT